ncbi:cell division protein FtsQ/DivIB [Actinomadura sp. 6N118]|uniref:cell division protein FtsQ/DivIB n=1 Tax=Actinomadura sp. 6N118 TaxID=3375151 RepID=UPI0037894C4C
MGTGRESAIEDRADEPSDPGRPVSAERQRAGRWKVLFVTLLVVSLLGAAAWVLLGSRLLVVRHVEVTGTKLAPRDRVVAAAGIRLGGPMARLGTGSVRARVEKLREVESARIERHWPGTVRIVVRERVPLVTVERAARFYQLDKHGVIVTDTPVRPGRMPGLTATAPGPTDPATLAALRVVDALPPRLSKSLTEVEAPTPESVTLRLTGGLTVVWGSGERSSEKLRLLDALQRTAAGRAARTIDVSSPEVVTTR